MKKMIVNTALLIALSTLLSGCEMQMQHRVEEWYKEGVSKKDTDTKLAKCTYDVGMNKVDALEKTVESQAQQERPQAQRPPVTPSVPSTHLTRSDLTISYMVKIIKKMEVQYTILQMEI